MSDDSKYTAVIGDNELESRNQIAELLEGAGFTVLVAVSCGSELKEYCRDYRPDLVVMDTSLDEENLNLCYELRSMGEEMQLILLSRSSENISFYENGYQLAVIDVLRKPFCPERSKRAIERSIKRSKEYRVLTRLKYNSNEQQDKQIVYKWKNRNYIISKSKILFIERVSQKKCKMILSDDTAVECNSSLKELHIQFPANLIFANKSCLVNRRYIETIIPDALIPGNFEVRLKSCKISLIMSRRYFKTYYKPDHK